MAFRLCVRLQRSFRRRQSARAGRGYSRAGAQFQHRRGRCRVAADRGAHRAQRARCRAGGLPCSAGGAADVRLLEVRIATAEPARALAAIAATLGLAAPPRADSPDALYNAERELLDGFRVVPLFHLADVYGVAPRVKGGPGISPLGQWRLENVWLEGGRP